MISSAVVIPEQPPPLSESPPTVSLKRRQSSISSDSNKRPRFETRESSGRYSHQGSPPVSASLSGGLNSSSKDSHRRSSLTTGTNAVEERKRGQRLFGALLGTLSQTSSKPAHRKRDEIEKRQQERLKKDDAEREEEVRRKRDEINKIRRVEQKSWDEESMHMRHRNMRAMATVLKTKSEPFLYYKPWELREEEELRIKRQIEEVEESIRSELAKHAAQKGEETGINDSMHSPTIKVQGKVQKEIEARNGLDSKLADRTADDDIEEQGNSKGDNGVNGTKSIQADVNEKDSTPDQSLPRNDEQPEPKLISQEDEKPKEDDHGGEELVEGNEDDVIY